MNEKDLRWYQQRKRRTDHENKEILERKELFKKEALTLELWECNPKRDWTTVKEKPFYALVFLDETLSRCWAISFKLALDSAKKAYDEMRKELGV